MNDPPDGLRDGLRDPLAAMWRPSWRTQTVHVLLASYEATAFAMVDIHAALLLRDRTRELRW